MAIHLHLVARRSAARPVRAVRRRPGPAGRRACTGTASATPRSPVWRAGAGHDPRGGRLAGRPEAAGVVWRGHVASPLPVGASLSVLLRPSGSSSSRAERPVRLRARHPGGDFRGRRASRPGRTAHRRCPCSTGWDSCGRRRPGGRAGYGRGAGGPAARRVRPERVPGRAAGRLPESGSPAPSSPARWQPCQVGDRAIHGGALLMLRHPFVVLVARSRPAEVGHVWPGSRYAAWCSCSTCCWSTITYQLTTRTHSLVSGTPAGCSSTRSACSTHLGRPPRPDGGPGGEASR
ncbi:hypothetical protein HBB16_19495 [Pseudonocardia sp. MCCB 268]|nr:hypothetical protein [Pseudonocardia cytotoxica]